MVKHRSDVKDGVDAAQTLKRELYLLGVIVLPQDWVAHIANIQCARPSLPFSILTTEAGREKGLVSWAVVTFP